MATMLVALAWAYVLFVLYLAYVTLWVAKNNGRLAAAPLPVRFIAWSILGTAAVVDGLFNIVVGSLLFLEPPELHRLMFTDRCKKWMNDPGWRGRIARWVCEGWLNPFEDHHC